MVIWISLRDMIKKYIVYHFISNAKKVKYFKTNNIIKFSYSLHIIDDKNAPLHETNM